MSVEQAHVVDRSDVKERAAGCRPLDPLDPRITSIQPGGGVCMRIELAWGYWRRKVLRTFWPQYVERMKSTRRGMENVCPHEVLDPRDVKYYRNLGGFYWLPADDPYAWRDRLPFVRVGLAELVLLGGAMVLLTVALCFVFWPLAAVSALLALGVAWFFRNPRRAAPAGKGLVVAPADGRIVAVEEIEDAYVGGAAVRVDIFLSVFNVHVNRVPVAARVVGLYYRPGKFANALRRSASRENEQLEVRLEESSPPFRPFIVRQIAGAIARRIVCWVAPGETLGRGDPFGMIKLGSRTELVLPLETGLEIYARVGQKVKAGVTVLARYVSEGADGGAGGGSGQGA